MVLKNKKIIYWGPYSGHIGTIKAQINSAHAMVHYGEYDAVLIRAHSEFQGMEKELVDKGIRLLDLGLSRYFPGLDQSQRFARRPYMWVCALFGFFPLVATLRREQPDVVIMNLITVPALLACIVSGISAVRIISIQGYPHFLGVQGEQVPLWKRIENGVRKFLWNNIYPKADYLLAMTYQTREKLIKNTELDSDQVQVMNNPVVDQDVLSGMDKPAPHELLHGDIPVIVGVGRLTRQKGFDVLIDALSKLKRMGIKANLLIVGEGEDRFILEQQIKRLGLDSCVLLLGFQVDPYPYIAHSDLFVMSSRWEDPGHAIIEAAALNVPIVTTDCPSGPSDLVEQGAGGWICNNGDADDMAEKIRSAILTPDSNKQVIAARNADRYTLRAHFYAMKELFDEV